MLGDATRIVQCVVKLLSNAMMFTPTGGIPMGTRSGDLDPGVFLYLLRNEKLGDNELEDLFNHQSGLFALSCGESDVKMLEKRVRSNDPRAALALNIFAVSIQQGNRRLRCSSRWCGSSRLHRRHRGTQ